MFPWEDADWFVAKISTNKSLLGSFPSTNWTSPCSIFLSFPAYETPDIPPAHAYPTGFEELSELLLTKDETDKIPSVLNTIFSILILQFAIHVFSFYNLIVNSDLWVVNSSYHKAV